MQTLYEDSEITFDIYFKLRMRKQSIPSAPSSLVEESLGEGDIHKVRAILHPCQNSPV